MTLESAGPDSGRRRVLDLLRRAPAGLGVADLAQRLGLHPNTVRFHLNRLIAAGRVTRSVGQPGGPGRPRLTFRLAPEGDPDADRRNFRLLAEMLASFIAGTSADPAGDATRLGRSWGGHLARRPAPFQRVTDEEAVAELLRVLDDVGFAPRLGDDDQVLLHHCPFLEVAREHRTVVCAAHLGVMQGALEAAGGGVEATELQPFATPSVCVARLERSAPASR